MSRNGLRSVDTGRPESVDAGGHALLCLYQWDPTEVEPEHDDATHHDDDDLNYQRTQEWGCKDCNEEG